MSVFITGGTGFLGSYVLDELFRHDSVERLFVLTRSTEQQAPEKLWRSLQLHMDAARFYEILPRVVFVPGDLHAPGLGIADEMHARLLRECSSVLHVAASLNRRSAKQCFNSNLRGLLSVIGLAREIAEARGGLRRFSMVSTTAVSGQREHQVVGEDEAVDWDISDYDPYARTKKFGEHMVRTLLADLPFQILRPPTVMGDSRFPETTQFEMLQVYSMMARAPAVPVHPSTRLDFVPANFVGPSIAKLHLLEAPRWDTYHLSAGTSSQTAAEHRAALSDAGMRTPRLWPKLHGPFDWVATQMANGPRGQLSRIGALLDVFLPYFTNDVVFDNRRVVEELGVSPPRFVDYAPALVEWAESVNFEYPYRPLPAAPSPSAGASTSQRV